MAEHAQQYAGLEEPCPVCGRTSGDHTLREWAVCVGRPTLDLPYEDVAPDLAEAAAENLRRSFGIDGDVLIADHVVARALTLDGRSGPVRVTFPAVLNEFQVGVAGKSPVPIAKVLFVGSGESVRGYGRLLRDTSNGAVNAAARAGRHG